MPFNSFIFIVFFICVAITYYSIPHKYRWMLLLGASYFFYSCFDIAYLYFIAFSTVISFFAARAIHKSESDKIKKRYLSAVILLTLGILVFFKYYNFSASSINNFLQVNGYNLNLPISKLILNVGISFYTFQVMGYVLDVYYEKREPESHFGIYALYISFFPKLVSGPIEKSTQLLPQFHNKIVFDYARTNVGLKRVLWGFFKKLVIADNLSIIVDKVFQNPADYGTWDLIIAAILYAIQVYCDFSSYSDIAIGLSKILGFDVMENFKQPYLSTSVTDFWRRWHISLMTWFTEYLYTPIVMSLKRWRIKGIIIAIFITFIISGLWHGAGYMYIVWGILQATLLSYEILTRKFRLQISSRIPRRLAIPFFTILTFSFICLSDIVMRSTSFAEASNYISHIFSGSLFHKPVIIEKSVFVILIIYLFIGWTGRHQPFAIADIGYKWNKVFRWSFYYIVLFTVLYYANGEKQFLYLQF